MNLTAEQQEQLKRQRYGMYTPDGNLRVAQHIINFLLTVADEDHDDYDPKSVDMVVTDIQHKVASDGDWCNEVHDTAVYEAIATVIISMLFPLNCAECGVALDPVWETEGYCAKCLDGLITRYENDRD